MRPSKWAATAALLLALSGCRPQTPDPEPTTPPAPPSSSATECVKQPKNGLKESKYLSTAQFRKIWGCDYVLDQTVPYGDDFTQYDYHASGQPTVRFSIGTGVQGYKSWQGDVGAHSGSGWTKDDKSGHDVRVMYGVEIDGCVCDAVKKTGRYIGVYVDYGSPVGENDKRLATNDLKLRLTLRQALSN